MTANASCAPSAGATRQLLVQVIAARQDYADYLRAVANGQRRDDPPEKLRLKARCDETLQAWRAAHDAWRRATPARRGHDPQHRL